MIIAVNSTQIRAHKQRIQSNKPYSQKTYVSKNPSFGDFPWQWCISLTPFVAMLVMVGGFVVGSIRNNGKK